LRPHEVLEAQGIEVLLVDTRQLAQLPARQEDGPDRLRMDSMAA
jgi:hypothetical protein